MEVDVDNGGVELIEEGVFEAIMTGLEVIVIMRERTSRFMLRLYGLSESYMRARQECIVFLRLTTAVDYGPHICPHW